MCVSIGVYVCICMCVYVFICVPMYLRILSVVTYRECSYAVKMA